MSATVAAEATQAPLPCDGVERAAHLVGAADLFVFRRVEGERFLHVGGVGRGTGWAGIVELQLSAEPHARAAVTGRVHVTSAPTAERMFGPYYAASAAFVAIDNDVIVVFGALAHTDVAHETFVQAAHDAAREIEFVSPAKRLADELEVLHAIKAMAAADVEAVEDVCEHIAQRSAEALSCEIGVLYRPQSETLIVTGDSANILPDRSVVLQGMQELFAQVEELPLCVQEIAVRPLPFVRAGSGVRSYYILPIGSPASALMILIHTDACPRGFTLLCQELGLRLAESGESLLRTAELRERLQQQLEEVNRDARRDALTGLSNRLGWQERLDQAASRPGTGAVLIIDLDGLKTANDTYGHDFGDQLIMATADELRVHAPGGFVARIGGDEFVVLLEGADEPSAAATAQAIRDALAAHPGVDGFPLSAAVGYGIRAAGGSYRSALATADRAMYADKRKRAGSREKR